MLNVWRSRDVVANPSHLATHAGEVTGFIQKSSKEANGQTSSQTNRRPSKPTIKETNKQASKQGSKQMKNRSNTESNAQSCPATSIRESKAQCFKSKLEKKWKRCN